MDITGGKSKWEEKLIRSKTIDTLILEYGDPYFIKIDVEGHESKVLSGLGSPVPAISLEYTGGYTDQFMSCIVELDRLGYSKYMIFSPYKTVINGKKTKRFTIYESSRNEFVDYYGNLKNMSKEIF
tara:strand:- start:16 stop:393 length:378 start_codon:yes stop_codon:yes gene_type:complete